MFVLDLIQSYVPMLAKSCYVYILLFDERTQQLNSTPEMHLVPTLWDLNTHHFGREEPHVPLGQEAIDRYVYLLYVLFFWKCNRTNKG